MRKTFKILLLAVMLLVMVGMTMLIASAEGGQFEVVKGSESQGTFETFDEAYAKVKETGADTIKLLGNVTVDKAIVIDTALTIDGQGNTLTFAETFTGVDANAETGTEAQFVYAITADTASDVTLKEITIAVTSTNKVNAITQKSTGTLTLYNAVVTGAQYSLVHQGTGKIVLDGENTAVGFGNNGNTWVVQAPGTLEIKAGKIDTTDGGGDLFQITAGGKGANLVMTGGEIKSGGDVCYATNAYNVTVTNNDDANDYLSITYSALDYIYSVHTDCVNGTNKYPGAYIHELVNALYHYEEAAKAYFDNRN